MVEGLEKFTEMVALPDQAINTEDIPWIPHSEGVWFKPLRFDLTTGNWIHLTKMTSGAKIRRHRHTGGPVLAYPLQGEWYYLERDWVAKPGKMIYEPPGDIHTLVVDKDKGEMITLFLLGGVIQYLDDDNNIIEQDDIFLRLKKYTDYCEKHNIPIVNLKY